MSPTTGQSITRDYSKKGKERKEENPKVGKLLKKKPFSILMCSVLVFLVMFQPYEH